MAHGTVESDKGVGIGVALSVLAVVGAVVMFASGDQVTVAWAFALAMTAASLAVVAVHVYGE